MSVTYFPDLKKKIELIEPLAFFRIQCYFKETLPDFNTKFLFKI